MRRHILLLVIFFLGFASFSFAEMKSVLGGYKLGQSLEIVTNELGKPWQVIDFGDGFVAYVYVMQGHFLIFQTAPMRPGIIWAIQIQGKHNPEYYGLGKINLGDPVEKALREFGKPDIQKTAIDEKTRKEMKGIVFYSYDETSNFSFEAISNKVFSVKIHSPWVAQSKNDDVNIIDRFLEAVKQKDYYQIASFLSPEFSLDTGGNSVKIKGSVIKAIMEDKNIHDMLFHPTKGVISLKSSHISDHVMKFRGTSQDGRTVNGLMFTATLSHDKRTLTQPLVFTFVQSDEGWVLHSIHVK